MEVAGVTHRAFGSVVLAVWLASAAVGQAEIASGTYLAARAASVGADFPAAAEWFDAAIAEDPVNTAMIEQALIAHVGMGDFDRAVALAGRARSLGHDIQLANMVEVGLAAQDGDWSRILADLGLGHGVGPLLDGLTRAWAQVGAGAMSEALVAFDEVADLPGLKAFGLYHKGLALASVGDFEGADAIFSMTPDTGFQRTRRSVLAHVAILSQLGRDGDALALLQEVFGADTDPAAVALGEKLRSGEAVPYDVVNTPQEGLAEVYLSVAASLLGEVPDPVVLTHARIALAIDPDLTDARLLVAETLDRLSLYELAAATYAEVGAEDPAFVAAELGRAEVLRRSDRMDLAVEQFV